MSRPVPGSSFAGYEILAECGHGAYGHVYLAEDPTGRRVALKYLLSPEAGEYELRGLRNYMSVATPSPALLRIFHCGLDDGCLFYCMEAADNAAAPGEPYLPDTLALRLRDQGRLPAAEALALAHHLLDGLETLHAAGLLHRDLKPENILFVDGHPKLADPGLTRHFEETLSLAGTPGYIPPEFLTGHPHGSPAADLYALGKLLYRAVTGNPPEDYPLLPSDVPVAELYQVCHPLTRLCNTAPAKRCATCAAARRILPHAIRHHGPIRRLRDALVLFPAFRRRVAAIAAAVLVATAILAAACAVAIARRAAGERATTRLQAAARIQAQRRHDALARDLDDAESHAIQLDLQLAVLGLPSRADDLKQIRSALDAGELDAAEAALARHRQTLADLAQRHLPADTASSLTANGRGWGYLASPLGKRYLAPQSRDEFLQRLKREAAALSDKDSPTAGSPFAASTLLHPPFAFLAPGVFRSPTTRSVQHLDYPFWLATTEVSGTSLTSICDLPVKRNPVNLAAEFLSWNDALFYCRQLNQMFALNLALPKGYAVRIPTEAEWEFAALGGWESTLPPPRAIPPNTPNAPPGTGVPNAFGLFNLDDNLAELVSPYPEAPPDRHGAAVIRGASYRARRTSIYLRDIYLRDQCHAKGAAALRPVIAPTPANYYQTAWYRGPTIRYASIDSNVYAGFATVATSTRWNDAIQLAAALGATLPDTPSDLPRIYDRLNLPLLFPCHIAVHFQDGAWRRLADRTPVNATGLPTQPPPDRTALYASAQGCTPIAPRQNAPVILLKWSSDDAFQQRLNTFLDRARITDFVLDGRHFVVCRTGRFIGYAMRPFAAFLGARQPVIPSPDFLHRLLERIPQNIRCALGPIRYYNGWEQADHTLLFNIAEEPLAKAYINPLHAETLFCLCSYQGKLLHADFADAILLEVP